MKLDPTPGTCNGKIGLFHGGAEVRGNGSSVNPSLRLLLKHLDARGRLNNIHTCTTEHYVSWLTFHSQ